MFAVLLATASSLAVLVVVFVPLKRVFPSRAGQRVFRREWSLDLAFFLGQYLVWNVAAIVLLSSADAWCAGFTAGARAFVASWPVWLQAAAAVLLGDFLVYWFHRACHAWQPLWRIHAVHHSSTKLDWLAAHREHPLDGLLTQLFANLPAFLLGFDVTQLAALATFRGMWSIFIHSNVRLPLGPFKWLLRAPQLHHWHHAKHARVTKNFANTAPWLDLVFRTHHAPRADECYEVGVAEPMPGDYVGHL